MGNISGEFDEPWPDFSLYELQESARDLDSFVSAFHHAGGLTQQRSLVASYALTHKLLHHLNELHSLGIDPELLRDLFDQRDDG
ncbi:hypothetical protein ACVW0K_002681 [Streptomyces filamentosus]